MRPIRWPAAVALIAATLVGCTGGEVSDARQALTVFAAASLTEAFTELAAAFEEEHPDSSIKLNFDGSQRLRFQLEHGARADVFASADQKQMDRAQESGLLTSGIAEFASNRLVLIVPNSSAGVELEEEVGSRTGGAPRVESTVETLDDLTRKGVKLALAQPEVPAGRYSRILIQRLAADPLFGPEYARSVLANVVTEEPSVRNVLQKVVLGEVDAGFVYYSDIQVASNVLVIQLPIAANVVANYTVAVLKNSGQQPLAKTFVEFIMSDAGQGILKDHGFGPPQPEARSQRLTFRKACAST